MGSCYCAASWNWLKLAALTAQAFLWESWASVEPRAPKVLHSTDFFSEGVVDRWETAPWCFLLHYLHTHTHTHIYAYLCHHTSMFIKLSSWGIKYDLLKFFHFSNDNIIKSVTKHSMQVWIVVAYFQSHDREDIFSLEENLVAAL
jgi:hypothetical protein